MAGFAVRHPNGQIVHPYQWQASSEYGDQQSTGGYYSVCVDNQFSRFAGKLINIYLTVIKYDEWDKFTKEIEALQLNMENFTTTIKTVCRLGQLALPPPHLKSNRFLNSRWRGTSTTCNSSRCTRGTERPEIRLYWRTITDTCRTGLLCRFWSSP